MKKIYQWKVHFVMIVVLFPYLAGFGSSDADSSGTTIGFMLGTGSFADVSRDCSGKVVGVNHVPFQDASASVEYHTPNVRAGMKVGTVHIAENKLHDVWGVRLVSTDQTFSYGNPNIGFTTSFVAVDAGLLFMNHNNIHGIGSSFTTFPTGRLCVGDLSEWYTSVSLCDNMPFLTGGGIFDAGIGLRNIGSTSDLWFGIGLYPYDRGVLSARASFPVFDNSVFDVRGSYSPLYGEFGLALGGKINF